MDRRRASVHGCMSRRNEPLPPVPTVMSWLQWHRCRVATAVDQPLVFLCPLISGRSRRTPLYWACASRAVLKATIGTASARLKAVL